MQKSSQNTILLVEDESEIRLLYAEILTDAGYKVIQAKNGAEAKEKSQNEDWDVMLLDVILPEMDGIEVLRLLNDSPTLKKGATIMLTNLNNDNVLKQARQLGAVGYLVKSDITPDKIIHAVEKALKKHSK